MAEQNRGEMAMVPDRTNYHHSEIRVNQVTGSGRASLVSPITVMGVDIAVVFLFLLPGPIILDRCEGRRSPENDALLLLTPETL